MRTIRYVLVAVVVLALAGLLIATNSNQTSIHKTQSQYRSQPAQSAQFVPTTRAENTHILLQGIDLSEFPAASDRVRQLGQRIADMKAQGLYDETLWDEYYHALYPSRTHLPPGLDQGGENCADATVISALAFSDTGTTEGYTDDYDFAGAYSCPWASNSPDVVYQYAPLTDEMIDVSLCNSLYDTKLWVCEDLCDSAHVIECDDDGCGFYRGYTSTITDLTVNFGHTYFFIVDGYGGDEGDYIINIDYSPFRPENDDCQNAFPISCDTSNVFVDLLGATGECTNINEYPEVWYSFSLDAAVASYWNVALSYCDSDPNISLVSANIQNDCLCDDAIGWTSVSSAVCPSPAGLPEWIYIEGVPAGDYLLPIFNDLGTYMIFDLACEPADCPTISCTGSPEIPNDGGCWEPPYQSQPIECGEVICGTIISEPPIRDTDWYQITVNEPTVFTWHVEHDSPLDMSISVLDVTCNELYFADNSYCQETIETDCLPPGMYYFYAAHHDVTGVPNPTNYMATLDCAPCFPPPCPNPEVEPNDRLPIPQFIAMGDTFCGVITSHNDTDLVNLDVPEETAVRITLNGDGIIHPMVRILTRVGDWIALGLDTTNQSNQFTSDFKLGQGIYVLMVQGAENTTGCYEMWVEPEILPTVAPPEPVLTIGMIGDQVELTWFAEYFPDELVQIERAESPNGPWMHLADVPGEQNSYIDISPPGNHAFYRAIAVGEREPDPFVGSTITVSEWDGMGGDQEFLDFVIQDVRWAVTDSNRITMSRLLAQGSTPDDDYWIDTDLRAGYGQGLTPIKDFKGHILGIFGREVLIDHIAYTQNDQGEISFVDGFGTDPKSDTTLSFVGEVRLLQGNLMPRQIPPFTSWACLATKCCYLKTIAICAAVPWAPRFPCNFPPAQPTPQACELRTQPFAAGWKSFCICPRQPIPPIPPWFPGWTANPMLCKFYILIKCKHDYCPEYWPPEYCWCPVGMPPPNKCPVLRKWTVVPWTPRWAKALCTVWCKYR